MSFIDGFDLAITAFKYRNALEHVERFLSRFTQNTDFSFLALFSFLSCFRIFTQNFSVQNFKNFGRCQINKIEKWRHTNVEASTRIKIIRKWFGIASIEMDMRLYAGDTCTVFSPTTTMINTENRISFALFDWWNFSRKPINFSTK